MENRHALKRNARRVP